MKKVILLLLIIIFSISTFGQKSEFKLIALDSTWGQEVIRFPARHMDYIGVGEIRFPPKRSWIKPAIISVLITIPLILAAIYGQ